MGIRKVYGASAIATRIYHTLEEALTRFDRRNTCAILNSRQSKRPCGRDVWVRNTELAVRALLPQHPLFLTSIGLNTWELVVHLVNMLGGTQLIVVPHELKDANYETPDDLIRDFRLDTDRSELLLLPIDGDSPDANWSKTRDASIIRMSETVVPISVRRGGSLEDMIPSSKKPTIETFRTNYSRPIDKVDYSCIGKRLNPDLGGDWRYLSHWTRSSHDPYSGQDRLEYYDSILNSTSYPNSALSTLKRIVKQGTISGSSRFIRGGRRVVSLSSLSPAEVLPLIRWRRRYVYYSFEPYGIAIDRDAAESLGCRAAIYGTTEDYDRLDACDRPYFQSAGSGVSDWRPEAEWRFLGDLNFTMLDPDAIRLVVLNEAEAEQLASLSPFAVVPLTIGG